jgi:hypothetical protein
MFQEIIDSFEEDLDNENSSLFLTMTDKLVIDAFKEQFENRSFIIKQTNLISLLDEKFKYLKNKYQPEQDNRVQINKLNKKENELYYLILDLFKEKLDISYNDLLYGESMEIDELKYLVSELYTFNIINYLENLKYLVLNYINENLTTIVERYKDTLNKKDLDFSLNKKKIGINNFILIKNLKKIINEIIQEMNISNNRIIENIVNYDRGESNLLFIKEIFEDEKIILGSNFDEMFFFPITTDERKFSSFLSELQELLLNKEN